VATSKQPRAAGGYGHGCGHNLLGAASALAAVAVKETLEASRLPGTIRFYGTPAEEGGDGKVYMARAGVFGDLDVVLHWHPGDRNVAPAGSTLAIMGARFRFSGQAAHAASAPDKGRSALDGLMLMAHAVDLLREHIPTAARVHYIVTRGGAAPNIVPSAADMYLYARHPQMEVLDGIWQRVVRCAEAGALATDTEMQMELVGSSYEVLPNDALTRLLDRNLREVGGVTYTPGETAFAEALRKTLPIEDALPLGSQNGVRPSDEPFAIGSTDAGDISWIAPTGWIFAATHVPGVPNHSWQATACTGHSIGRKGMMVAAKTLALTAVDLLTTPAEVEAARADFDRRRAGKQYRSRLPSDMKPPLDYRERSDR
jgi:aminobenzoyl-glutamate utilization protein B